MPSVPAFPSWPRPVRMLMRPLGISADGMSRQQRFLEVISENIANAQTTRTPDGGPYQRQVATAEGGQVSVKTDAQPGRSIYDPGHPDADPQGFVRMPNVDVNIEMVDLMIARRVHEANATVFEAAKSMLKRALEI